MKDSILLASVAVFRSLYDNKRDIYDVIGEFIRASICMNSKWSFNLIECEQCLQYDFGFKIPSAVISSCLKNRLKKNLEIEYHNGIYTITDKFVKNDNVSQQSRKMQQEYGKILELLVDYAHKDFGPKIDTEKLKNSFVSHFLGVRADDIYDRIILKFLLKNESSFAFMEKLNQIEEGCILYAGIQCAPDLSTLGHWKNDLVIFMDTEHLLSATGLNGVLYQKIFEDFKMLIDDVNQKSGNGKILLRYFTETNDEISNFFYAAEKIVERSELPDPSKTAMMSIVEGCSSPSEVLQKKSKFYDDLHKLKIRIEDEIDYYEHKEYNIEAVSSVEELISEFGYPVNGKDDIYYATLKKFTKINVLRRGNSNRSIDRVAAIFLTENNLVRKIAFFRGIHPGNGSIPYAINIEFLTERLWFKLNKGFGNDVKKPISFNAIIKAKLVMASQINNAVSESYKELKRKYINKEISNLQAAMLLRDLRSKPANPDNVNYQSVNDSSVIFDKNFIEESMNTISILENQIDEGKKAKKELAKLKFQQRTELRRPLKKIAIRQFVATRLFCYIIVPVSIFYALIILYSPQDTRLSIFFGIISLVGLCVSVIKIKIIDNFIWKLSKKWYLNRVRGLL